MAAIAASSISTPGAISLELPGSSRWDTTIAHRDVRATSSRGSQPYGAKANHSKERDQAEARFKKAQKATQDAKEARADYESEARTVREKNCKTESTSVGRRK